MSYFISEFYVFLGIGYSEKYFAQYILCCSTVWEAAVYGTLLLLQRRGKYIKCILDVHRRQLIGEN